MHDPCQTQRHRKNPAIAIELITFFMKARHHRIKANNGQIHQPKAIITTLQAKADLAGKTNLSDGLTKQKCVLHHVYAAGKLANMQRLVSPNPD